MPFVPSQSPEEINLLKEQYDLVESLTEKGNMALRWIMDEENNIDFNNLRYFIPADLDEDVKARILYYWVAKNIGVQALDSALSLITDYSYKAKLILNWFTVEENNLSLETLINHYFNIANFSTEDLDYMLTSCFDKQESFTLATLESFIESSEYNRFTKGVIAELWIKAQPENNFDIAFLLKVLSAIQVHQESPIIAAWTSKPENFSIELKDPQSIISDPLLDRTLKGIMLELWLKKDPNNNCDISVLNTWIDQISEHQEINLLCAWISKEKNFDQQLECVQRLLRDPNFASKLKSKLIQTFIESKPRSCCDEKRLKEWLELIKDGEKEEVLFSWISKDPEQHKQYEDLRKAIKIGAFGDIYSNDYYYIVVQYQKLYFPPKQAITLCREIYPNSEYMQSLFISGCIDLAIFKGQEGKDILKQFIGELKSADCALDLIQEHGFSVKETFELCAGRTRNQYKTISGILETQTIARSLSEEGVRFMQEFIGLSDEEVQTTTLDNLFSYCELSDEVKKFTQALIPEVRETIRNNFKVPPKTTYLTEKEHNNLSLLLGGKMPEMFSTEILCKYLQDNIPPIPHIELSTYKIHFPDFIETAHGKITIPEQTRDELTAEFKELITKPDPTDEEISKLMLRIIGDEHIILGTEDKENLGKYFRGNRELMIYFLQTENGVNELNSSIWGIGDGCVANFAMQVRNCAEQSLIKDPGVRALNLLFTEEITKKIFSHSENDELGGRAQGENKFTSEIIVKSFLFPESFVNLVLECMENDNKKPQDIIEHSFKAHGMKPEDAKEKMGEALGEWGIETSAKIAAYIALKPLLELQNEEGKKVFNIPENSSINPADFEKKIRDFLPDPNIIRPGLMQIDSARKSANLIV